MHWLITATFADGRVDEQEVPDFETALECLCDFIESGSVFTTMTEGYNEYWATC